MIEWSDFTGFYKVLNATITALESYADLFLTASKSMGYIFALVYIVRKYGQRIEEERSMQLSDFFYPIFVSLMLFYYKDIGKGIEGAFLGLSNDVNNTRLETQAPLAKKFFNYFEETEKDQLKSLEDKNKKWTTDIDDAVEKAKKLDEKVNGVGGGSGIPGGNNDGNTVLDGLKNIYKSINPVNWVKEWVYEIEKLIFECGAKFAVMGMYLVAKSYLLIYYVLGPLAFAFSLVPSFEFSITNWFQRYITYCLWMPIFNFFLAIAVGFIESYKQYDLDSSTMAPSLAPMAVAFLILIVGVFVTAKVASNILSAAPSGSMIRGAANAAKTAAKAVATLV